MHKGTKHKCHLFLKTARKSFPCSLNFTFLTLL